ncbi:MAG: hypothetical protein M3N54_07345, partial [Acidobacteriota bacterium]|nr:hypothetical protein [Acidobacteriota bacterium]
DIEGAEIRAVAGARQTILRDRPQICVAAEHTDDLFANAKAVIDSIQAVNSAYEYVCTESHPYKSPGHGLVLTPYSLLFQ